LRLTGELLIGGGATRGSQGELRGIDPATGKTLETDLATSVGTPAIARFPRPVGYQNLPSARRPDELKPENPPGLARRIDGKLKRN
jgi:hypothetical protein